MYHFLKINGIIKKKEKEKIKMLIEEYLKSLLNTKYFNLLLVFVAFDIFFGILRAIKERKINSCIGINGLIRKTGMNFSNVFLFVIDTLINLNFIFFFLDIGTPVGDSLSR